MTTITAPVRTHVLDEDWFVVIQEQIDAAPDTLADTLEPYVMGCYEAEMGLPCEPLTHYAKLGDIEQYIIGWKEIDALLNAGSASGDDAYGRGWQDYHARNYAPPACDAPGYADYLRGFNDAWAAVHGRIILR